MKICLSCEGIAAVEQSTCGSCGTPLLDRDAVHYPQRRGEADAVNPLIGSVIDGKYRLTSVLGRGGMGVVFRAVHEVSLVPLALKLLHPRHSQRLDYKKALIAEARQAGRVVHDRVARVLDAGETAEGNVYLAMELAAGETLDACPLPLPPAAAVELLVQGCHALVAIHGAGLVHRDLSARNVMVAVQDGKPVVKVLDFGVARSASLLARGGEAMAAANPAFSAPEHLAGQDVDERADLYGLGVIGYLLLTGQLPVDAPDPREVARATLEGRLVPLPPVAGAPRRLLRLLASCLQRDPERRPQSAGVVLAELEALRGHGRRLLPRLAIASSVIAAVLAALAYGLSREPYLLLVPGGPLVTLSNGNLAADAPVIYLQPDRLGTVSFTFGGFDPAQLLVEISRGGTSLSTYPLEPTGRDGKLVLATAQLGWSAALSGIERSSEEGALDLQFRVPWWPPFGSVRVCLDREPPQCSLRCEDANGTLAGRSRLEMQANDHIALAGCELVLRGADGAVVRLVVDPGRAAPWTGVDLLPLLPGVAATGPLSLQLVATDRAGNTAISELQFAHADLSAPRLEQVLGAAGELVIPYLGNEVALQLQLSQPERDLRVEVVDPSGVVLPLRLQPADEDGRCHAMMSGRAAAAEPFADGGYTFVVRDAAENSARTVLPLQFKSRRVDPRLELPRGGDAGGRAALVGDELVLDGAALELRFMCNPAFTVAQVGLEGPNGTPLPLPTPATQPGSCALQLPSLVPGSYRLVLHLEPSGAGLRPELAQQTYELRVLPDPVVLHIGDTEQRFLHQLVVRDVFVQLDGQLRDGASFRMEPWLRPLLGGRVWIGGGPWTPLPLAEPGAGDTRLLPPIQPNLGLNMLALDLVDALGRPVRVLCGERPAPLQHIDGRELPVVARFYHDPEGPVQPGEEVRVEHGQAAAVVLRSRLPFAAADASSLRLSLGSQNEFRATAVVPRGEGGAWISFRLPFAVWSQAARLLVPSEGSSSVADLPHADYARGLPAQLDATLDSPAGLQGLHLQLRTARTTLRPLPLGDLQPPGALPPPIAGIQLVPVLAPEPPVWIEPVPQDAPGRDLYCARPPGNVTNIVDFLLQDREVTWAQYLAVLDAFFALPQRPALQLWHGDDKLGEARLQRAQLLPAGIDAAVSSQSLLAGRAESAITDLDFFQVTCWCRLLSVLIGDDPELLRLPLGCELELAAFGGRNPGAAHNAAAANGAPIRTAPFSAFAAWWETGRPAPTAADCRDAGDSAPTPFERPILGLDFGVREWVGDLPRGNEGGVRELLNEWTTDHEQHLRHVRELARAHGAGDRLLPMREFGVVRGLSLGELDGLIDPVTGARCDITATPLLPAPVPGVVRTEQLRRDGRDLLPGRRNPKLMRTGFRVAGDAAFAELARRRGR